MSKPLGISELVARVGDENIQVQNIGHNMTAANNGKKMATITFATSPEHCQQMMRLGAGIKSSIVGLVLWMPADKRTPDKSRAPDADAARCGAGAGGDSETQAEGHA